MIPDCLPVICDVVCWSNRDSSTDFPLVVVLMIRVRLDSLVCEFMCGSVALTKRSLRLGFFLNAAMGLYGRNAVEFSRI